MPSQHSFDLTGLDAEAPDLHLMVEAAQKLERILGWLASELSLT